MARLVEIAEFVGPGEQITAQHLERMLPDEWLVVCNRELPRERSSREVDFIVVGQHAIFPVEEKHWWGEITGNENGWVLDSGESFPSPIRTVVEVAKRLISFLKPIMNTATTPTDLRQCVLGLVVLSHADVTLRVDDPRWHRQVLMLDGCEEDLERLDAELGAQTSIGAVRSEVIKRLEDLPGRPALPRRVSNYAIESRISAVGPVLSLRGRHDDGSERILKLVRRPTTADPERRKAVERSLLREYEALRRLSPSGHVPTVDPYFSWDQDQFWVLPLHLLDGRTLRAAAIESSHRDARRTQAIAARAFEALAVLHHEGVVHRGITPDRVYVRQDDTVAFSDLLVARIEGTETVALEVDELDPDNEWRAPECRHDASLATVASDVYSLARCLHYWLARIDPQQQEAGVLLDRRPDLDPDLMRLLDDCIGRCLNEDAEQRPSAAELAQALAIVTSSSNGPDSTADGARGEYQPGERIEGRYEVIRRLGAGASATTYLVSDLLTDTSVVLKCIRDASLAERLARTEWRQLKDLAHQHLPRVYDVYPSDHPFQLKLEYVRGSPLRELAESFRGDSGACRSIGLQVLDALRYLADKNRIHRDVSASNILIPDEEDGHVVLIDFGLATEDERAETAVGTPRYRAPEIDRGNTWTSSCDLYALGVVLFEMLTGTLPYELEDEVPRKQHLRPLSDEERRRLGGRLPDTLYQAVNPDPGKRFQSAEEFAEGLRRSAAPERLEPPGTEVINPTVDALRALYRNSRIGNADNRGLDSDFALATYVGTKLDAELLPAIVAGRYRLVILSGNPGDGKTAFLQHLLEELTSRGASVTSRDDAGWLVSLQGRRISAVYDASESHGERSADDLVREALEPLRDERGGEDYTAVIAVNDGRLLDFFERTGPADYPSLWAAVEAQLFGHPHSDNSVLVVDLKRRALVGGEPASVLERILDELVGEAYWQSCQSCVAREECPIYFNARSLADAALAPVVRDRLHDMSLAVHLRREQRPTLRDLRSSLGFLITHDLGCADIHAERHAERSPLDEESRLYFSAAFNGSGTPDLLLEEWRQLDPALVASPKLDRFLHFHRRGEQAGGLTGLFLTAERRAEISPVEALEKGEEWLATLKRRYFFEGRTADAMDGRVDLPEPSSLSPYRALAAFRDALRDDTDDRQLVRLLLAGIAQADGVPAGARGDQLALRLNDIASTELAVIKRFPEAELRVRRAASGERFVEGVPDQLILEHGSGAPQLGITLDLFEFLLRAAAGYLPGCEEQKPLLEDLATFKDQLLARPTEEVVLVDAGGRFHRVKQRDGQLIRAIET